MMLYIVLVNSLVHYTKNLAQSVSRIVPVSRVHEGQNSLMQWYIS